MSRAARRTSLAVAAVLVSAACAGKTTWESAAREVYVVTLPSGALVLRDGQPVGRSPVGVPVPAALAESAGGSQQLRIRAEKDGYQAASQVIESAQLPDKVMIVLAPVFGEGETPPPPPKPDDAGGLYELGAALQRNGRCEEAMEFLTVVTELAPRVAKPYRELGTCLAKLGETRAAADHWAKYLLLAPDAKDAAEIQARLDRARGTRTLDLPPPKEEDF